MESPECRYETKLIIKNRFAKNEVTVIPVGYDSFDGCSVGERKWKEEGDVFNSLIHREEGSIWQDCFNLL